MINKTMPERITLHVFNNGETFPDNVCVTEIKPGALLPDDVDEAEYIRADLADGDPNEPLVDGQHRWVKPKGEPCWQISFVLLNGDGGFEFYVHGSSIPRFAESDIAKIGPVIRPPEMD